MTGILVLAAGGSRRLGRPKQLLKLGNKTLLDHAIKAASEVANSRVVVILGADAEQIRLRILPSEAKTVENPLWTEGIASSIRKGVKVLTDISPSVNYIICMVCDQPYINTPLLEKLISVAAITERGIVASDYKSTPGTPVLFKQKYFSKLLELKGDDGAKKILFQNTGDVETIPFAMGHIDVDTVDDYNNLKKTYK